MLARGISLFLILPGLLLAQDTSLIFSPGDYFSISHTPMNAKMVPVDCNVKKVPIHSYKHAGNEATFLIPDDSPTCTYEVNGTQIRVVRSDSKQDSEAKAPKAPMLPVK